MILDFTGFPIDVNDRVVFGDYFEGCLKFGTVTSMDRIYITVKVDGSTFRLQGHDVVVHRGLSLTKK